MPELKLAPNGSVNCVSEMQRIAAITAAQDVAECSVLELLALAAADLHVAIECSVYGQSAWKPPKQNASTGVTHGEGDVRGLPGRRIMLAGFSLCKDVPPRRIVEHVLGWHGFKHISTTNAGTKGTNRLVYSFAGQKVDGSKLVSVVRSLLTFPPGYATVLSASVRTTSDQTIDLNPVLDYLDTSRIQQRYVFNDFSDSDGTDADDALWDWDDGEDESGDGPGAYLDLDE